MVKLFDKDVFISLQDTFLTVYKVGNMSKMTALNKKFEQAVVFFDSIHDYQNQINALHYLGRTSLALSKPSEAYHSFVFADSLYQYHKIRDNKLKHSIDYYKVYSKVQHTKKLHFDETVAVYEKYKTKPRDEYVFALSEEYLARVYIDSAYYDKAIFNLQNAIQYFEKEGFNLSASIAYSVLGVAYDGKEDIENSLQAYKKSVAIGEQLKEPNYSVLASNSYNIGLMYQDRLGNAVKAIDYLHKAVDYDKASEAQQSYLVDDYTSLAAAYLAKYDFNNAKIYAELALSIAKEKLPDTEFYRKAIAYFTLSTVHADNNEVVEALDFAQKGYDLIIKNTPEKHRYVCNANLHLGNVHLKNKDTLNAITYFKKTAQIAKEIKRGVFEVQANKQLINLSREPQEVRTFFSRQDALFSEKFEDAFKYKMENELQKLSFYERNKDTFHSKLTYANLSKLIKKENFYAEIAIQLKAYEIAIFNNNSFTLKKEVQSFIKLVINSKNKYQNPSNKVFFSNQLKEPIAKVLQIVYYHFKKTNDKDYLQLAYQLIEVNKNTVLLEGLQYVSFKNVTGIPKEIFEKEEALQEKINNNYQYIHYYKNSSKANQDSIRKLFHKQLTYEKEYATFLLDVEEKYPNYANAKKLNVIQDYSNFVKNKIQDDEVVLLYFIDGTIWYRLLLSQKEVRLEQFKTGKEVLKKTLQLQENIKQRKTIASLSKELANMIAPKLEPNIKRITVIADDFLNIIPFEILQVKDQFLFEKVAVRYAGSVQLLNKQMEMMLSNTNTDWVGFAPQYVTAELPNNEREVEAVQEIIGGKAYVKTSASKENFIAESSQNGIIHLATHTELNQLNPMFNQMRFSNTTKNNSLTAAEVYNLKIPAHLAVLSSCNTGFGKLEKSEGLMSMSRSFTYAGVSSTVMSMWKVPDKETSEIMVYFYNNLTLGKPKDEALQLAKLEYLEKQQDEDLKHPYYWAGFIVAGNVEALPVAKSYWIYVVFSTLVLSLGIFFYVKKKRF
ncbi:CHAT domain-containing protein [Flavobacterium sp. J27]|uniref:CHAT domain-containing protein n=1 Tax=Flavobacterium sp. J27 TaxID=2060419 RepID=UPI0013EECF48|nr:CHAT domain-containing protein [Flavobacterium sp. J27]